MAVLKGYFDDSGDTSLPALSVAGYVGTDRLWEVFKIQWSESLSPAWDTLLPHEGNLGP